MADISRIAGQLRGQFPRELPRLNDLQPPKLPQGIPGGEGDERSGTTRAAGGADFKETLGGLLQDVDHIQKVAHESGQRMLTFAIPKLHIYSLFFF